jgi:TRAP-type C4-dicarboxylate transport system permease small subunit
VLNDSLFWSEELGRILLVWLTFLGATVAYRRGAHLGVDSLVHRLPPRARAGAGAAAHLVCLALFAAMAVYGFGYVRLLAGQSTPALGWPAGLGAGAVPLAGAVLCVHALARLAGGQAPDAPDAPGGRQPAGTPQARRRAPPPGGRAVSAACCWPPWRRCSCWACPWPWPWARRGSGRCCSRTRRRPCSPCSA